MLPHMWGLAEARPEQPPMRPVSAMTAAQGVCGCKPHQPELSPTTTQALPAQRPWRGPCIGTALQRPGLQTG